MTEPVDPTAQSDEVVAVLMDTTAATIEDVRALGISEEEISDEEIIDALEVAVTAEMATEGAVR